MGVAKYGEVSLVRARFGNFKQRIIKIIRF